eukprot:1159092-Pelagomonas_calceolata.AAC.3
MSHICCILKGVQAVQTDDDLLGLATDEGDMCLKPYLLRKCWMHMPGGCPKQAINFRNLYVTHQRTSDKLDEDELVVAMQETEPTFHSIDFVQSQLINQEAPDALAEEELVACLLALHALHGAQGAPAMQMVQMRDEPVGAPGNEDGADEDEPVVANAKRPRDSDGEDEDGEDNVEEDALRRAMEDNPELAKEFEGKLQQKVGGGRLGQARAATEKDAGNRAFASKQYKEAVEHFTKCIELDPG